MGVQTQGGRDGQNGPPIISVIFFGRDDERGIRRCSWCSDSSEPKRGTSEGSGAAARDASVSFRVAMPPPIRAVARGGSISKNPLFISNRPPSTPKTSIGSMMRLADPAIPSLLQEGLPTRREPTFDREALRASARLLCRPSFSFRFTSYSSRS